MENANSYEYLEKIKIAVIENLKKTAPAPSVQMTDIPRASMGLTDEEEAELDDLDADENKDARMTQRQWEKSTAAHDDPYESDDDEMARANGIYRLDGTRRSILDHPNPNADTTMDSGIATPKQNGDDAVPDTNDADDTMVDEAAEEPKEAAQPEEAPAPAKDDGDVDMADASMVETDAPVKREEVDAQLSLQDEGDKPVATAEAEAAPAASTNAAAAEPTKEEQSSADKPAGEDKMEVDEPQPPQADKKADSPSGDASASADKA
jgi:histone deacetylase 1/2